MRLQFTKTTSEWTCETQFFVARIVPPTPVSHWQFFLNGEFLSTAETLEEIRDFAEVSVLHCLSHQIEEMSSFLAKGSGNLAPMFVFCSFPRPAWCAHYRHWSLRAEMENGLYRPYCAACILPLEKNIMLAFLSAEKELHGRVQTEINALLGEITRRKEHHERHTNILQGGGHSKTEETPLLDI